MIDHKLFYATKADHGYDIQEEDILQKVSYGSVTHHHDLKCVTSYLQETYPRFDIVEMYYIRGSRPTRWKIFMEERE